MKTLTALLCLNLTLSLFSASEGWSADLQVGMDSYNKGDYETTLREWKPPAEQGDSRAQFNLGVLYANGNGVPQNYQTAISWWTLAAQQEDMDAQYNLGLMYFNGDGVQQDYQTAAKWWTLAAEQGYVLAQYDLGWLYHQGQGVLQDNLHAYMWFHIAASRGDKDAVRHRDIVPKEMTSEDISTAKTLVGECVKKNYKSC